MYALHIMKTLWPPSGKECLQCRVGHLLCVYNAGAGLHESVSMPTPVSIPNDQGVVKLCTGADSCFAITGKLQQHRLMLHSCVGVESVTIPKF